MELEEKFSELKAKGDAAFMAHIYYGDPTEESSFKLAKALCNNGVDILEFGIPFTDPIADGPTFQAACTRALKNRMDVAKCFSAIKKLRKNRIAQPIVVTSYYNLVYKTGVENFIKKIKNSGAQALIVPDAPIEESETLLKYGKENDVSIIFLVTPRTNSKRLKKICRAANGFLYLVNLEGVTGAREKLDVPILDLVKKIKKQTNIPLLAGFGISKTEHTKKIIGTGTDGIIIGSAIAKIYRKNLKNPEKATKGVEKFCKKIKKVCKVSGTQSLLHKTFKYKINHRGG